MKKKKSKSSLFGQIDSIKKSILNLSGRSSKMFSHITHGFDTMRDFIDNYKIDSNEYEVKLINFKNNIKNKEKNEVTYKIDKEYSVNKTIKPRSHFKIKNSFKKSYSNEMLIQKMLKKKFKNVIQSTKKAKNTLNYKKIFPSLSRPISNRKAKTPHSMVKKMKERKLSSDSIIHIYDKTHNFTVYDIERKTMNFSSSADLIRKINKEVFKYKRFFNSNPFLSPSLNNTKYKNIKNLVYSSSSSSFRPTKKISNPFQTIQIGTKNIESDTNKINLAINFDLAKEEKFKEKKQELYKSEKEKQMSKTIEEVTKIQDLIKNNNTKTIRMDKFQRITSINQMKKELDALSNLNDNVAYEQRVFFGTKLKMFKKKKMGREGKKS